MSILKWLLVFTYLLWVLVTVSALLKPTIKSLIPLIVCSTCVIVGTVVIKIDDSEQNTLKLNEVYTVDTSMNTTEDRVYKKQI